MLLEKNKPLRILLSRTDNIGDVILTLPMAGIIKSYYPHSHIIFLGKSYTKDIVNASQYIDEFCNWDDLQKLPEAQALEALRQTKADALIHVFPNRQLARLAKKARIPLRIGTSRRWFHLFTCNKLVSLSRKNSPHLHESQLNLKLLQPLGITEAFSTHDIPRFYGLTKFAPLPEHLKSMLDTKKFNLILHPKSKGSAREWGLTNFSALISLLPKEKFHIFITGTKEEASEIEAKLLQTHPEITSLVGKVTLSELVSFIAHADGLIAASTGPLHIAAALGKHALGLYPPIQAMTPVRWGPLGSKAQALVSHPKEGLYCSLKCATICKCMNDLSPHAVQDMIQSWATHL